METIERTPILCVDDEPHVLDAVRRHLRRGFAVTTALGPEAGLAEVEQNGPFAVVVSDLRMPGMDGVAFLSRVREIAPDSVRVLLTGNADLESAMAAVNEGSIFRFLAKPSSPETLNVALAAAAEQYRLIMSERLLLEETLHGSIKALTDTLALIHPAGFGRATRAKSLIAEFLSFVDAGSRWEVEIAAMLSQIGVVALPQETVEKLYRGEKMTYAETLAVDRLPRVTSELIGGIPRLEGVREIVACQGLRFDGKGGSKLTRAGEEIPWGARLLTLVLDFDALLSRQMSTADAIAALKAREGWYDPELLEQFAELHAVTEQQQVVAVELRAVQVGMIFAQDVLTPSGLLLVARGQEASERLLERVRNLAHLSAVKETVQMIVPSVGRHKGNNEHKPNVVSGAVPLTA